MLTDERLHGVDSLLIEGTTLGSSGGTHGLQKQADVEDKLVELSRGDAGKLVAVVASGQNVDRLVSCYRAARRSGRLLIIDPYQAFVPMKLASLSKNIPQFSWDGVRVSFVPHQVARLKKAGLMELAYQMSDAGARLKRSAHRRARALPDVHARQLRCDQTLRQDRSATRRGRVVDVERLLAARRLRDPPVGRTRRCRGPHGP